MKNKFKKVIAASLAVSVLLAFTGCGSNQAPSADNKKQESASTADTAGILSRKKNMIRCAKTLRRSAALKKRSQRSKKRLQKRILPTVDPQNQMNLLVYSRISREKTWMERMSMKAFSKITKLPL